MSANRDWLILSLKWSKGDWFKWYRTASAGYTSSLLHAGRYTEEEARGEQTRCPEHCMAVHIDHVAKMSQPQLVLLNDGRTLKKLRRLSNRKVGAQ